MRIACRLSVVLLTIVAGLPTAGCVGADDGGAAPAVG